MNLTDAELSNIVAKAVANVYYPKVKYDEKDTISIPKNCIEVAVHAARLASVETIQKYLNTSAGKF